MQVESGVVTLSGSVLCDGCGGNATPGGAGTVQQSLGAVVRALTTVPEGFALNPKVARRLPEVRRAVEEWMPKYEYQSDFAKKYVAQGHAEGLSRGRAEEAARNVGDAELAQPSAASAASSTDGDAGAETAGAALGAAALDEGLDRLAAGRLAARASRMGRIVARPSRPCSTGGTPVPQMALGSAVKHEQHR